MFHSKLFVYWRVVNKVIIIMVTNRCPHKRRSNTKMPWGLRRGIMLVKNFNFTGVHGRIEIHLYFMGAIHQLTSGGTHFIYVNIETPLKGVLSCVTYVYILYICVWLMKLMGITSSTIRLWASQKTGTKTHVNRKFEFPFFPTIPCQWHAAQQNHLQRCLWFLDFRRSFIK